ncbi:MAG: NAD(P)H-binding protein [Daejeonella sp.]|uniref:NAD-dependent epimerase/dehydratase family protein n=1 Tax=Daejeonella sp. TaxID=2805397 RepID=UPI00273435B6|nr:NAD-dependent epimerase/dehydratase family protein [Daejeonella sp.]MDP3467135.1 NAD(P)H-binding protein [Daejeonella sp.]
MPHQVILVGASGLIGSHLLTQLIESVEISRILLLLRKPLHISAHKVQELIVNFDELEHYSSDIKGDVIFSCLGTTKAATPDSDLYRKIDLEYPLKLAEIGTRNGVSQFHLVSSLGANALASNAYLKLKGELENELKNLSISSLHIYQPSLLTGNRKESRLGEKFAISVFKLINPLLIGPFKKYRSIEAETVARVMLNQSLKDLKGTFIYPSIKIQKLA